MIKGNFEFHPVGHGLFYTGQIRSANHINFVFDCGRSRFEKNSQEIRKDCINNYLKSNHVQKLDMLFISHLHEDHINGIPYLLSSINNNCERVILPYFTPFQRLFLIAEYLFGGDGLKGPNDPDGSSSPNNDVLDIIKEPHSYFLKKGINVVYVNGGNDNNERESDEDFNNENGKERNSQDRYLKIDISENDNIDEINSIEGANINNKQNNNISSVKLLDGNRIKFDRFWEFIVYNGKLKNYKIEKFKREIYKTFQKKKITTDVLNEIISEEKNLKCLASIYSQLFKSKINDYGLMLIHRPIFANHEYIELEFNNCESCRKYKDSKFDCYCHCYSTCRRFHCICENMCYNPFSTLLTGDRGLKYLLNNVNSNIAPELNCVSVFQVPHHGSNKNWKKDKEIDGDNRILRYFNDRLCKHAIIPCNNSENFPRPIVLKDLVSHSFDIRIVNDIPFNYEINIHIH